MNKEISGVLSEKMDIAQCIQNKRERFNIIALPDKPGVYLFKGNKDSVIYVGKAKSLKKRVYSYFSNTHDDAPKTRALVLNSTGIDFIVVNSEVEALVLESRMVKKYRPRYNVRLKDDKSFPYIGLTLDEEFPRLIKTRYRKRKTKNLYFGPFVKVASVERVIKYLSQTFLLCTCLTEIKASKRFNTGACLKYDIKRCSGPCLGKIGPDEYALKVETTLGFLQSGGVGHIDSIKKMMKESSVKLDFEKAAFYRDLLDDLKALGLKQIVENSARTRADVFGIAGNPRIITITVVSYVEGDFAAKQAFMFPVTDPMVSSELYGALKNDEIPEINGMNGSDFLEEVIKAFYISNPLPGEILIPFELPDYENLEKWFSNNSNRSISLSVPQRGIKRKFVSLARLNAMEELKTRMHKLEKDDKKRQTLLHLKALRDIAGLARVPLRIVCFDISNLGENQAVAGMTCFVNGIKSRGDYRKFKIKSVQGQDDFAMMNEAVSRFLAHLGEPGWIRPDLMIIDGGPGQLSAALGAVRKHDETSIDVISLAKRFEEIYHPKTKSPIRIPLDSPVSLLVRKIRDETHRYAITFHRKMRQKVSFTSILDNVPGIGPKRKKALMKKYKGLDNLQKMDISSLQELGIPEKTCSVLLEFVKKALNSVDL